MAPHRSNEAKKLSVAINIKPLTALQKLMISPEFDAAIILIILANCVVMASESPVLPVTPYYIYVSNFFFNVSSSSLHILTKEILESSTSHSLISFSQLQIVFILELVSQIIAFGILPYFSDYWHWLDGIVVASSLLDLIVAILTELSGFINGVNIHVNTKGNVLREMLSFEYLSATHSSLELP